MTACPIEAVDSPCERTADIRTAMARIARFCSGQRVEMRDEKMAQSQMERLLTGAEFVFKREYRLSAQDIPDFLITEGGFSIVVEMKTRATRMKIYRQLERYSKHSNVDGIILLSGTAMGVPDLIGDKPAMYASMGRAWLR